MLFFSVILDQVGSWLVLACVVPVAVIGECACVLVPVRGCVLSAGTLFL